MIILFANPVSPIIAPIQDSILTISSRIGLIAYPMFGRFFKGIDLFPPPIQYHLMLTNLVIL